MSSRMNAYIMDVLDSQTLETINGTEIVLVTSPPPTTSAGEEAAKRMMKEFALKWVSINIVENVKGVLHTDNIKIIAAPNKDFPKIQVLERLVKGVRGKGSLFHKKDFLGIDKAAEAVTAMVDLGFLTSKVYWFDKENDDSYEVEDKELQEAKATGTWFNHRGDPIEFNGENFMSSFLSTARLVRLSQAQVEEEELDPEDTEDLIKGAKEAAYDEVVLWLTRVSNAGADPLRMAAKVLASKLRERAHILGDVLVDWRPVKAKVVNEGLVHKPIVVPTRDYDSDATKFKDESTKNPFGPPDPFWGD